MQMVRAQMLLKHGRTIQLLHKTEQQWYIIHPLVRQRQGTGGLHGRP